MTQNTPHEFKAMPAGDFSVRRRRVNEGFPDDLRLRQLTEGEPMEVRRSCSGGLLREVKITLDGFILCAEGQQE